LFLLIGTLASLLMITQETVLDVWWKFSSIFGGAMLGLFLVGIIVRKATSFGAMLGAIAGILVIVWGTLFPHLGSNSAWYRFPFHANMVGPVSTFVIVIVAWFTSIVGTTPDEHER
ncbi:MAG: hypothetical protein KDB27_25275, partial [Planctomycetales bacterium]|nr:hypothetical protein [Planctomycetales bacterium]